MKDMFPSLNFQWLSKITEVTDRIPGEWRFVGGCVRDSLLGLKTYDIDITTLCKPEEIENELKDSFTLNTIGKKFGTIGVYYKGWSIEITTTRKDVQNDGRHAQVDFTNVSFYEDSARRDFTINALMMKDMCIYDYHNGVEDLLNGKVRFVGKAEERIEEDYLRVLRYIRFFIRFSKGDYDKDVLVKHVPYMRNLSRERVVKEMESMCKNAGACLGFRIMNEVGISDLFFGVKLRTDISDDFTIEQKMAYALYDADISHWPINKNVKKIHSFRSSLSDEKYMAYVWYKYKDVESIEQFNSLLVYLGKSPVAFRMTSFSMAERFKGKERGMAELLMRYYHIIGKSYTYEDICEKKDEFYYHIKKNVSN